MYDALGYITFYIAYTLISFLPLGYYPVLLLPLKNIHKENIPHSLVSFVV